MIDLKPILNVIQNVLRIVCLDLDCSCGLHECVEQGKKWDGGRGEIEIIHNWLIIGVVFNDEIVFKNKN